MESLLSVLGSVAINGNDSLISLTALHGVTDVGGDLTITDNVTCPTQESDDLVAAIGPANIAGTVTISNNAP